MAIPISILWTHPLGLPPRQRDHHQQNGCDPALTRAARPCRSRHAEHDGDNWQKHSPRSRWFAWRKHNAPAVAHIFNTTLERPVAKVTAIHPAVIMPFAE